MADGARLRLSLLAPATFVLPEDVRLIGAAPSASYQGRPLRPAVEGLSFAVGRLKQPADGAPTVLAKTYGLASSFFRYLFSCA